METEISAEEFYNVMVQLYPNETARGVAEIKAMKAEEENRKLRETIDQLTSDSGKEMGDEKPATK